MGSRGPVPKRSNQRHGHRAKEEVEAIDHAQGASNVDVPDADPEWHSIATRWFESLKESGQSRYYEPSDWAQAQYIAEAMSQNLTAGRFSAQLFAAVCAAATELLTTEGARRRLRLELERGEQVDPDEDAAIAKLDEYRARFSG